MTPPPITEAAGLLQSGAIFPRRVGLRRIGDPGTLATILAGFKRGGFSIYFEDAPICHFDLEGRWQRAFLAGTHYLKGLDATVRAVGRVREANQVILRRRTLSDGEVAAMDAQVVQLVQGVIDDLDNFTFLAPPAPSRPIGPPELRAILGKIAGWDAEAWANHQALYRQAYGEGPPPFLPPDCPNPVILRVSEGMSVASCGKQARAVVALLGRRLDQCRDVFLTGLGWIDRPESEVLALLGTINDVLPIQANQGRPRASVAGEDAPRLETIHAWVEDFTKIHHPADAWPRYRQAHVGRVTLRITPQPDVGALRTTVAHLKAAGIGVGLALFGASKGGSSLGTFAEVVSSLPLAVGDLIALVDADGDDQARISSVLPSIGGPRVVIYNPDKQWI